MLGLYQRTRTVVTETKEQREAIKADDKALTEAMPDFSGRIPPPAELHTLPEYQSIAEFAEFCIDDERETYTGAELRALCHNVRSSPQKVRADLLGYGLTLAPTAKARTVRGVTDNPHNKYAGNPMCGGSGFTPNGPGSRYR